MLSALTVSQALGMSELVTTYTPKVGSFLYIENTSKAKKESILKM